MNIIKVYGGLGNQMFQYAFGRAMEISGKEVCFDLSWFSKPTTPPRPYGLNKLRTNVKQGIGGDLMKTIHETKEQYYRYNPDFLLLNNHKFSGYWQNRNYFTSILPELKEEFKIIPAYRSEEYDIIRVKILSEQNSIALHIRRGDYLTKGHHLLPVEYYSKCLEYLNEKFTLQGSELFIFSDDLPWCKETFGTQATYIDFVDYLSLDLMRLCTHKITANSTFSLWAGILGEKQNSLTFAPVRWRLDDSEESAVSTEKLVPDNWIRL